MNKVSDIVTETMDTNMLQKIDKSIYFFGFFYNN